MTVAIRQAKIAQKKGDYAVGTVLVRGNKIITLSNNHSKRNESPIAHAETLAIIKACKIFKKRHLPQCVLYSTHEPCPMCSAVIVWAKLKGVVYGARYTDMKDYRKRFANRKYLWRTIDISCREVIGKSTEKVEIVKDFMRKRCKELFHN